MRKCQWGESALDTALGHLQAAGSLLLLSSSAQDITLPLELLTEIGAVFKMAQNAFNIKWRKLLVDLGTSSSSIRLRHFVFCAN